DHQRFPIDRVVADRPGLLVLCRSRATELSVQTRCKLLDHVLGDDHRSSSTDTHQSHRGASISADAACVSRPGMVNSPKYLARDPNRKWGSVQPFPNILTAPPLSMVSRTRRARVAGIGGMFFTAKDAKVLVGWFRWRWGND